MKLPLKVALVLLGALSVFSCSDDELENQAPSVPVISFPSENAADVLTDVTLKWNASTDPEKGAVQYDVYISTSEKLTDADIKSKDQMEVEYKAPLAGHTQYFWKVVAKDDTGAIAECNVSSFTTANSVPTVSTGSFPSDKSENVTSVVKFKWTASTDDDKDEVLYFLYVSEKEVFTKDDIKGSELAVNEFELTLEGHTKYFWQVVIKDSEGGRVESAMSSFTTENSAPSKPIFKKPAGVLVEPIISFSWDASTDADNDELTYSVYISENTDFSTLDYKNEGLSSLEWNDVSVKFATKYYYKLVVKDALGRITESDVNSFSTRENDFSEDGKITVIPSSDDALSTLKWKPCRGENVKYTVYFGTKEALSVADIVADKIDELEYTCTRFYVNTTYYWKVVASGGVSIEGDVNSFTTGNFGVFVDIRDNHVYKTVKIDGVTWMAENLAFMPYLINDTEDSKKCSVYGYDIDKVEATVADAKANENFSKYGAMYSWSMLEDIAPEGWHVASDQEWKQIEKASGMATDELESKSYRGSTSAQFKSVEGWDPVGTDDLGFNIMPCGGWELGDKMIDERAYFWTSTPYITEWSTSSAFVRVFALDKEGIYRKNLKKTGRFYVRLVKDSE